jgi:hypothetical protein
LVTSTTPVCAVTVPSDRDRSVATIARSVTSRATVVHSGLSACTTATASSTQNSSTT